MLKDWIKKTAEHFLTDDIAVISENESTIPAAGEIGKNSARVWKMNVDDVGFRGTDLADHLRAERR